MSALGQPQFHNHNADFACLGEPLRPQDTFFLHCGGTERVVAMDSGGLGQSDRASGTAGIIEADQTLPGSERESVRKLTNRYKVRVVAFVSRSTDQICGTVLDDEKPAEIAPLLGKNIANNAVLILDNASMPLKAAQKIVDHQMAFDRQGECGRRIVHTNTIGRYFSASNFIMKGADLHCANRSLNTHTMEFGFQRSNRVKMGGCNARRSNRGVFVLDGTWLMYQDSSWSQSR